MLDIPKGKPNFSVILPGKCNCKCNFCFWKYEESPDSWLENLVNTIHNLPPEYVRCSISGGEPTLSPVFDSVFDIISACRKWEAIVLTTNGTLLDKKMKSITSINHLNLSRHHHDEAINAEIFKTTSVPKKTELTLICKQANHLGIDVNLNCVLIDKIPNSGSVYKGINSTSQFNSRQHVIEFIKFAKDIGASSVCFRQDQSLNSTEMPHEFSWFKDIKYIEGWSCEACKIYQQYIEGMRVAWKAAIAEPSIKTGTIYELIYHQNGKLTSDWEGKLEVNLTPHTPKTKPTKSKNFSAKENATYKASTCGFVSRCGV